MRMNRVLLMALFIIAGMICVGTIAIGGEESDETLCIPIGTIVIESPEGVESKRASVDFPHSLHFSISCNDCHHKWEGQAKLKGCSAAGCHDLLKTPKGPENGQKYRYYKFAYHRGCIDCHKDINIQNKKIEMSKNITDIKMLKTGPTACIKCHPKE